MCDMQNSANQDELENRIERLEGTIQAILDQMKVSVQYTPEKYTVVKQTEVPTMTVR
jgi:hypothetical protein